MFPIRTNIGDLQRLHDAIALTMDAIRRLGATATPPSVPVTGQTPWIPAPPTEPRVASGGPRLEHSAWQPAWPIQPSPQGFVQPPSWPEWQRETMQVAWPPQAWAMAPWLGGPFRPF